jgi:iron complex outermembrane receptor protein
VAYEHTSSCRTAGIIPRISTHFEAKSWLSYFNQGAPDQQKSYTRTDLTVRYEPPTDPWSVEAFVQNLEDKNIKTGAGTAGQGNYPVRSGPRSIRRRAPGASVCGRSSRP